MKPYFLLLLLSAGCSSMSWTDACGEIRRTGFASDLSAGRMTIEINKDCEKKIVLEGANSLQSESAKAIAQGVTEGALKAMIPVP